MEEKVFEEILKEHERRIYYFIHHLGIRDQGDEYYQEGLVALWEAYKTFDAAKGGFDTYANWKIKNAMIDRIRKANRHSEKEAYYKQMNTYKDGWEQPHEMVDEKLWEGIRHQLTNNQWKWVVQFIIEDKSVAQIAAKERVSQDTVKNWGRHAKRKLKTFAPLVDER
ncbi:sigma-70 family RNA polymerase sigma factor [Salimicrobium halophilum]|uniref:RNA polymerase sigma factor, sigma-70 family n=1 Tax=Salimicrobium halophilum TaxID=86666 RepID=A0A1G8S282_9BACI|nr:sigma-70 family RNA polymerase sigma factor [Salimicrobium halophilum]SDJ23347.1 RNA polymerase sigma factor, sigma-70 family [Salimicrobium halophilum]